MGKVNVPKEWQFGVFGELVAESFVGLVRAAALQGQERQYQYLKMNNLNTKGEFDLTNLVKIDANEQEIEKYQLNPGDFIFNTRNSIELVGKCGVFGEVTKFPVLFNNNLLKVIFYFIDPRIVAYWFNSPIGKGQLRDVTSATTSVAAIYQKQLFGLHLPLPPLAEQKVIADKLDTLLAQVETTKARLDRIPQILKTFRQSVLAAAVSGKLTEEWREVNEFSNNVLHNIRFEKNSWANKNLDHNEVKRVLKRVKDSLNITNKKATGLPEMWSWSRLEDSVLMIVDCHNKTAPYTEQGTPLVRTSNIRDGKFIWENLRYVSDETYEYWSRRCPPEPGDLIFTREAPMGEAAIIPLKHKLCLGQRTMLIRPVEKYVSAKFLLIALMDPNFRKRSEQLAVGTGVKHYRVGDVSNLEVAIPPTEEQTQIVRRVEELFAFADVIEQKAKAALELVNNLTQSILAKAFRGELTADWRAANPELISGDNSAEALLAKIKTEREALSSKKKPKKKAAARKKA
jgi:type I restriction enzyme S subunit